MSILHLSSEECVFTLFLSQEWIIIHNSKETLDYLQSLASLILFFLLRFCEELYIKQVPLLSVMGVPRTFHRKQC